MYFTAVLEADEWRALIHIERASKAIEDRLAQLRCGGYGDPQELQDLASALTYLRLLLESIDPEVRDTHDSSRHWVPIAS